MASLTRGSVPPIVGVVNAGTMGPATAASAAVVVVVDAGVAAVVTMSGLLLTIIINV